MITLTIDNQHITVEPGTTLLATAQRLGIAIPTLCFLSGTAPFSSCMVCLVAVSGQPHLIPSCTALAEEGMVVQTNTPEVLAARKNAVALLLSEHTGDCLAPCQRACPHNLNIPMLIRHLQKQDFNAALETLAQAADPADLSLCERCRKPCETVCRRHLQDEAVAIADLIKAAQAFAVRKPAPPRMPAGPKKPARFCSVIRQIRPEEVAVFSRQASPRARVQPRHPSAGFTPEQAVQESFRCLHCDCRKQDSCQLRDRADQLEARQMTFAGARPPYAQQVAAAYLYEPGKCIKCGICVGVCEQAGVPAGFTFIHRGFNTKITVPFDRFENQELDAVLQVCIDLCPTGALCRNDQ
ncbi:(2Fe-2S)-binding protein [candidate division FCPU426 bacterium]|nr:(2Fe-2S)-binding protein [candidate division FCPU426 bacterium]